MAATVWKGNISFGLVSVPIRLYTAARNTHVSFHMVHRECGSRVKQQYWCPVDGRVVERKELAKAYPLDKHTNVIVEEQELKDIQPESSEVMEIVEFVKMSELDPIYFDASYYALPEEAGRRAYELLLLAMKDKDVAAVAKLTMHQREHIVAIRPYDGGITLHTLFYPAEVREVEGYGDKLKVDLQAKEIALAGQFVSALTGKFEPEKFKDTYEGQVLKLIEAKAEGKPITGNAPKRPLTPTGDLMEALRQSIEQSGKPTTAAKSAGRAAKKPVRRATVTEIRRHKAS
jgi:DNA end-binding protein Ku